MPHKRLPAALAMVFSGLLVFSPSQGLSSGFPVVDVANLGQSIMQVMQAMLQVMKQVEQIQKLKQQVDNQMRLLETLDSSSFSELSRHLVDQMNQMNNLLGKLTVIKYRTEGLKNEFASLFPKNSDWDAVHANAYGDYLARWHDEVLNAALTAMNAQSSLTHLFNRNAEIQKLLSQSADADGVVRQLQVVNEMLAVCTGHITDLASALITTGRMTSTATAMRASQERMAREAAIRARRNYTKRGKPPKRLTHLPRFE